MKKAIGLYLLLLIVCFTAKAQPGTNDPTFNTADLGFGLGDGPGNATEILCSAIQSDGKILIGGYFATYNSFESNYIARLNTDGGFDTTFNVGSGPVGGQGYISGIAIQSDGKILIGGFFQTYNGEPINNIARINADGSLDTSFNVGSGANNQISDIKIQSDGKILISGVFNAYNGVKSTGVTRINTDGSKDNTFIGDTVSNLISISTVNVQSDGKILIGGSFNSYNGYLVNKIARLNIDGSVDTTFGVGTGGITSGTRVYEIAIQNDGKILIVGAFAAYGGVTRGNVARLNTDGSLDTTFNAIVGSDNDVTAIKIQNDGKVIIGGKFGNYNGIPIIRIARLNADGSLDTSFNVGISANDIISTTSIQSDGKIIIGGGFTTFNNIQQKYVTRLNINGSLDSLFNKSSGVNNDVLTTAVLNNGKIIIGGTFSMYNGKAIRGLCLLNSNGVMDTSFIKGIGINSNVNVVAIQSDSNIVIGGTFTAYNGVLNQRIVRLKADGNLDTTFTGRAGNTVNAVAIQPDGKIIIGGDFTTYNGTTRNRISRLLTNGSLDFSLSIGSGANNTVRAVAIQIDGKIIIGGNFTTYNGTAVNRIARLNSNGSIDASFNIGSGSNSSIYSIFIQSDGKILIGGFFTSFNGIAVNRIARINIDGSVDTTFIAGSGANGIVRAFSIQNDGKIIIGGDFTTYNGTAINRIARLNADGSLDTTFNVGMGANYIVYTTAIQNNGKIIIGGDFTIYNGIGRNRIARLNIDSITSCNFSATATFTTTKVNCTNPNSGTATVTVSGGSSPYSYFWSSGGSSTTASGLAVGNYSLTITDNNGCTATSSVNITKLRCATLGPSPINVPFIQMPGAIIPR